MSKPSDVEKSIERMKVYMELRGLRPNTVFTFTYAARRFPEFVPVPVLKLGI